MSTCNKCKWWSEVGSKHNRRGGSFVDANCKRHAPILTTGADGQFYSLYPKTPPHDFCGDFVAFNFEDEDAQVDQGGPTKTRDA